MQENSKVWHTHKKIIVAEEVQLLGLLDGLYIQLQIYV